MSVRTRSRRRSFGALVLLMQEVVDLLHDEYIFADSVFQFVCWVAAESIRYKEVVELADALGYDLIWQKRRGNK